MQANVKVQRRVEVKVAELWRYPVKSVGGETLDRAHRDCLGIAGDRMVNVEKADVQETVRIIGDMPFTANTRHS
jgi:hypothetical protein